MRANRFVATLLFVGAYVPMIVLGTPAHGPHLLLITLWTLPGMVSILIALYRTTTPASLHITMHQALKMTIFFTILLIIAITITTYQTWLPHFGLYNPFNWII